jgi:single-strand DNA-binding protein
MASYNKVILVGNLTRDPELTYSQAGTAICKLGLAVNEKFTKQSGEKVEKVHFIDITAWAKTAETIAQYFHKGDPILVEGKIQQDRWQDQNTNQNRSKVYVVAERFTFVGNKRQDGGEGGGGGQGEGAAAGAGAGAVPEEDIPF